MVRMEPEPDDLIPTDMDWPNFYTSDQFADITTGVPSCLQSGLLSLVIVFNLLALICMFSSPKLRGSTKYATVTAMTFVDLLMGTFVLSLNLHHNLMESWDWCCGLRYGLVMIQYFVSMAIPILFVIALHIIYIRVNKGSAMTGCCVKFLCIFLPIFLPFLVILPLYYYGLIERDDGCSMDIKTIIFISLAAVAFVVPAIVLGIVTVISFVCRYISKPRVGYQPAEKQATPANAPEDCGDIIAASIVTLVSYTPLFFCFVAQQIALAGDAPYIGEDWVTPFSAVIYLTFFRMIILPFVWLLSPVYRGELRKWRVGKCCDDIPDDVSTRPSVVPAIHLQAAPLPEKVHI